MMQTRATGGIHPFWDRSIRRLLRRPENLAALVKLGDPDLAARLDFNRLVEINRSYVDESLRGSEADLVFRLPYRDVSRQREIIVYVLIEHQTKIDRRISFRLLRSVVRIGDEQYRARPRANLAAVVPVVFYTGRRPWAASLRLRSLVDAPRQLLKYVPDFDILYVGLPEIPAAALERVGGLGWALRALQRADASTPEFLAVAERAIRALDAITGERWRELMRFIVELAAHCRSGEELPRFDAVVRRRVSDRRRRMEARTMFKTMVETWLEQGEERGRIKATHDSILQLGEIRFGPPAARHKRLVHAETNLKRLQAMHRAVAKADNWNEALRRFTPTARRSRS